MPFDQTINHVKIVEEEVGTSYNEPPPVATTAPEPVATVAPIKEPEPAPVVKKKGRRKSFFGFK